MNSENQAKVSLFGPKGLWLFFVVFMSVAWLESCLGYAKRFVFDDYYSMPFFVSSFILHQFSLFVLAATVLSLRRVVSIYVYKTEGNRIRKLLLDLLPLAAICLIQRPTESFERTLLLLVLVYYPPLIFTASLILSGKYHIGYKILVPVAFIFALSLPSPIGRITDIVTAIVIAAPIFMVNCIISRLILTGRGGNTYLKPNAKHRMRSSVKTAVCIFAVSTLLCVSIVIGVFVMHYPQSKIPISSMAPTPDWSPHDNRIVIAAYKVRKAFVFGEPEGKALIYNADGKRIERRITLPGIPSKIEFPLSLYSMANPMVAWTWKKDELFYLKNGKEGVVFDSQGKKFKTIFKLPNNQVANSVFMMSPKRTKVFFVAYSNKLNLYSDKIGYPTGYYFFNIVLMEHFYIADLKKKTLVPLDIKHPYEDSYCLYTLGFSGWIDEDLIALDLPDCWQNCDNKFASRYPDKCKSGKNPLCHNVGDTNKSVFDAADGACLNDFPHLKGFQKGSSDIRFFGDGKHYININIPEMGESGKNTRKPICILLGDLSEGDIDLKTCINADQFGYTKEYWDPPIRSAAQSRVVPDSHDWMWVRVRDSNSKYLEPKLLNYKTGKFSDAFSESILEQHASVSGLSSPSGEFHVLGKQDSKEGSYISMIRSGKYSKDITRYKHIFDITYYEYSAMYGPSKFIFDIYDARGKRVGSVSMKDFKFQ